jgi:hypothetical protein
VGVVSEYIAKSVGQLGNKDIRPLHFSGHCYYVRKCLRGEQVGDDPLERHIDGVLIHEATANVSNWVVVLAKGPRVGHTCSKAHARKHGRKRTLVDEVEQGDMVLLQGDHPTGVFRSPLCDYEFFIEESLPLMRNEG